MNESREGTIAVSLKGVSKTFKAGNEEVHALQEVNFEARYGELMMIVGPSGCGKTTLLSVIAGTLRSDAGEVFVLDHPLHLASDEEITEFRRTHVGFIFQQYHLVKTLNVLENIAIPLLLNRVVWEEAMERSLVLLDQVGLKGRGDERPVNLSGGQQQRVAIARALIHHPSLLICDEPTSALDAAAGAHILELIAEIVKGTDRSILVVTHDPRIFKYADRLAKMDDGRILSIDADHRE